MVKKVNNGYKVYSKSGKPLSKTYSTKAQAQARLMEVHAYSKKGGK